jgi:hypothetical protein
MYGGCRFGSGINRTVANDVACLPSVDVFGNSLNTSLIGGSPFPYFLSTSSGKI